MKSTLSKSQKQPVSIIMTSGNRLANLQETFPALLSQESCDFEIILSIYADNQGTAKWVRNHHQSEIDSGLIVLLETTAPFFSKAEAANLAAKIARGPLLLFIDSDIQIVNSRVLSTIVKIFEGNHFKIMSFSFWGIQVLTKKDFLFVNGYDPSFQAHDSRFTEGVYGDDMDLIARIVENLDGSFAMLGESTNNYFYSRGKHSFPRFSRIRPLTPNTFFLHINEVKAHARPINDFQDSLYFQKIGGTTSRKDFALIHHFYLARGRSHRKFH